MPSPITAVAFAHSQYLAVGRVNGNVDVVDVQNNFVCIGTLTGTSESPINALSWAVGTSKSHRLFSAALNGVIVEWDLAQRSPLSSIDSTGGAVWGMATNAASTALLVGGEDGGVRLFDITKGLHYKKTVFHHNARVLCVAWNSSGSQLGAGYADGVVRIHSVDTGLCTCRFVASSVGKTPTLVWAMAFVAGGDVVTGDSVGHVQFWDVNTGTPYQTVTTTDSGDIIALAANGSSAGTSVWAGCVDGRVAQLKCTHSSEGKPRWVLTSKIRAHTHDVRALAVSTVGGEELVVSGGTDTQACVFKSGRVLRKLWPFPPVLTLAVQRKLLLCRHANHLELFNIVNGNTLPLLRIDTKASHNLRCSAVSHCGRFIAAADAVETKLFEIGLDASDPQNTAVHKRTVPSTAHGATAVAFTVDSSCLVVGTARGVLVTVALPSLEVQNVFEQHIQEHNSPVAIVDVVVSPDGQWLASLDARSDIHLFNIDATRHTCALPRFESPPTVLHFHPSSAALVVACASNAVFIFNCDTMQLADWSRDFSTRLPKTLMASDPIVGITFNPGKTSTMMLSGNSYLCHVDFDQPLPEEDTKTLKRGKHGRSSADPKGAANSQNFHMITKYQPLMMASYWGADSLLVVERPWVQVMAQLPDPVFVHRYAT